MISGYYQLSITGKVSLLKILFATDLKEPRNITDRIQDLADRLEAELFILHVHVPTPSSSLDMDPRSGFAEMAYAIYDPAVEKKIVETERNEFHRFVEERFVRPAILQGDPARIILDNASELGVDLIVLAKHRHSAIERMLLGSVTNVVARESHQPVLLIPVAQDG